LNNNRNIGGSYTKVTQDNNEIEQIILYSAKLWLGKTLAN